jgi:tetratricopeptide (TPR) repeat protein
MSSGHCLHENNQSEEAGMNIRQRIIAVIVSALVPLAASAADSFDAQLLDLQEGWAKVNYQLSATAKPAAFAQLVQQADGLANANPTRAEPLVWKAIIMATEAGIKGGLGALSEVKQARGLLEQAEKIDPNTLNGSIYTSLGSLYYKVPSWPIGFGNKSRAEEYLKKALAMNPDGIDPNYFYGEFLFKQGRSADAAVYLKHALAASGRPDRPVADEGRRREATVLLHEIEAKLASK